MDDQQKFKAFVVTEEENGTFTRTVTERTIDALPEGDLLVRVRYSSLNYKDGLSASGNKGVTKAYPHTPGIDAAGEVVTCSSGRFLPGDQVLITGYDLGMNTAGGFGQMIRIPSEWALPLPNGLTLKETMMYGTAGLTAALSVYRLVNNGVKPGQGDVLVTGATGGVGSIAVRLLARLGYSVAAGTGKADAADLLREIGAASTIPREELSDPYGRPLLKPKWAGVIDTVGGNILATALKSTQYGGTVTACGNVMSPELPLTVFPFILKGISLLGIDSVQCPMELRKEIWSLLSREWKPATLSAGVQVVTLEQLSEKIDLILAGQLQGRVVVDLG